MNTIIEAMDQVFDRYGEVVSETTLLVEAAKIVAGGNHESDLEKYRMECEAFSQMRIYLYQANCKYGFRRGRNGGFTRHYLPDANTHQEMRWHLKEEADKSERYGIITNGVILPNL